MKSLFIFRRDYRLEDNTALIAALASSIHVIPIFIFTPEQLVNNPYKSDNCVQFMIESLEDLDKSLHKKGSKLFYFFGKPNLVIDSLIKKLKVDAVFVNTDYSPYSKKRDTKIESVCNKHKIKFETFEDILLQPVEAVKNGSGETYSKFTPFFNTARKIKVREVTKNNYNNYYSNKNKIVGEFKGNTDKFYKYNDLIAVHGGRENALKILAGIQKFKKYNTERNMLDRNTTRLSAYLKFGCVSIREVYYKFKEKLGTKNDLIKQLYWRDFYYNVGNAHSDIIENKKNLKSNYDKVPWITYDTATAQEKKDWKAWCDGTTGFPIVDAGMRELNATGFMHNRARLIVASFLVKDMFWSPFEGDKYFSRHLIDYCFLVNRNNWMWVSGGGTDSQLYLRIFNPNSQSEKHDPDCEYIKKWIPELKDIDSKHIHNWDKYYDQHPDINYPKPILNHSESAKQTIKKYKKALY